MRRLLSLSVAFAFACASTPSKKKKDDGDEPPGQTSEPTQKPKSSSSKAGDAEAFEKAVVENDKLMSSQNVDWKQVRSLWEDFTEKFPNHAIAWFNVGVARERSGDGEKAEAAYRKAMRSEGLLREAYENLASLLEKRGDHKAAWQVLEELVEKDPSAASARVQLAKARLADNDIESAERLSREALTRDPKNISAYCVLAEASLKGGDEQRTRLVAAQGLKIQDVGCLHQTLGFLLLKEKKTAEALAALEQAVRTDPTLVEARFRIAEISMGFKDFQKAIRNYSEITQVDPKNVAAYVNLGVAHKGTAQFEEAEKAYQKAIEVSGDKIPEAHFNLGVLYLRHMRRLDEAKEHLKRYLQLGESGPNDPAFGMIDEVDQLKAMEAEEKRQAAEAAHEEEMQKKADEAAAKEGAPADPK